MKRSFSAEIENDNVRIHDPLILTNFLKKIGETTRIVVTIQKWYKKHSDKQRKYYFGIPVTYLAAHTGFTPKEMHESLKWKFLAEPTRHISRVPSITGMSTVQMEEYMESIRIWAADSLNCYIPKPHECEAEYAYSLKNTTPKSNGFLM